MKFFFRITEVNRELLVKYPPAALDGNLTILIKDSLFFDENISLLDFAICVNGWLNKVKDTRRCTGLVNLFRIEKWLIKVKVDSLTDFDYSPDEYTESPILHLTKIDRQHYTIHSVWAEDYPETILDLDEITYCFDTFLRELDTYIQQSYGIAFSDMRFF